MENINLFENKTEQNYKTIKLQKKILMHFQTLFNVARKNCIEIIEFSALNLFLQLLRNYIYIEKQKSSNSHLFVLHDAHFFDA